MSMIMPDTGMPSALHPFIPPVLFRWPTFLQRPDHEVAMLFLDVAGFTRLSEALAALGPEGAERLDATIAGYFDALFEVIQAFDGHPIKVSGDALTIMIWEPDTDLELLARRAVQCANRLRSACGEAALVKLPGGGHITLAHKVGVGAGRVWSAIVGDPDIQRELVFAGEALERAARAEHHAATGEVWVCPEVVALLDIPSLWAGAGSSGCRMLAPGDLDGLAPRLEHNRAGALPRESPPPWLAELVPAVIRKGIADGALEYISKHKALTALFVSFSGLEFDSPNTLVRLDQHYRAMQEIVQRHGGFLAEFDAGDKGSKLILFFGAPRAIERPCAQAALCAREMQAKAREMRIVTSQQIGISTGRLYVGRIGCRNFAKFSALGDRMNLAARLMAVAEPWSVLAEELTIDRSREWVNWGERRNILVKGKTEPIVVAVLAPNGPKPRHERRGRTMIGRRQELDLAEKTLVDLSRGMGRLLLFEGQSGLGKSRLLDAIGARVVDRSLKVCRWSSSASQPLSRPFAAFVPLICDMLSLTLDPLEPYEQWRHRLPPSLKGAAGALSWILGLPCPDDRHLAGLSAAQRVTVLNRCLVDLIVFTTASQPYVLICDDAQNLDMASLGTLKELSPLLCDLQLVVILAGRPASDSSSNWLSTLAETEGARLHALPPLSNEALEQLTLNRIGVGALDRELRGLLEEKSGGNPLRLESWIDVLKGRNKIAIEENTAFLAGLDASEQLPDKIEQLLLTRLERLPAGVELTLATATVLSSVFQVSELAAIHPERVSEAVITQHLQICNAAGLIYRERSAQEGYFFASRELRVALYESQSFSLRRALHQSRVGILMANDPLVQLDETVIELASHLIHVDMPERQHECYRRAAQVSESCFDHRNAVHWWRRDLEICEKTGDLEQLNHAFDHLQLELGLAGEREARRAVIDQWVSSEPLSVSSRWRAPALLLRARNEAREGEIERGLEDVVLAISLARASQNLDLLAGALCEATTIYGEAGRLTECLATADEAMALPVRQEGMLWVRMLNQRGFALYSCGRHEEALKEYKTGLERLGDQDLGYRAVIQGNIAIILWSLGRADEAHALLLESLALKRRIGDRREEAMSLMNVGYSFFRLGDFKEACRYTEEARSIFVRLRNVQGEQLSSQNLVELYLNAGDFHLATLNAHRAQALLARRPHEGQLVELINLKGELCLAQGEPGKALPLFEEARLRASAADMRGAQVFALEGMAASHHSLGALETADACVSEALGMLEQAKDEHAYPQRVWLRAAGIARDRGALEEASRLQARARAILLEQLGLVTSTETRAAICTAFAWNRAILSVSPSPGFGRELQTHP